MFENDGEIQTTKVKISAGAFFSHVAFLAIFAIITLVGCTTNIVEDAFGNFDFNPFFATLDRAMDGVSEKFEKKFQSSTKTAHWQKQMDDCKFHLARSGIRNTGSGLYAGKDMDENEPIVIGSGDNFQLSTNDFSDLFLHMKHHINSNVKVFKTENGEAAFATSKPIHAYEELFLDVLDVEKLFPGALKTYRHIYPKAPVWKETYDEVDKIINHVHKYINSQPYVSDITVGSRNNRSQLWNPDNLRLLKNAISLYDTDAASILPESFEDWIEYKRKGVANSLSPKHKGSWMYYNGFCLDKVSLQPSTVEEGQKGLSIQKDIAKGDVILSTPIQFFKYSEHQDDDFVDHCFKPPRLDMLLCPLAFSGFINHAFASTCDSKEHNQECKDSANTAIDWYDDIMHSIKLKKASLNDVIQGIYPGIVLDFIAKRDIVAGEELTMDYGSTWKDALEKHKGDGLDVKSFHYPMDFKAKVPQLWTKV